MPDSRAIRRSLVYFLYLSVFFMVVINAVKRDLFEILRRRKYRLARFRSLFNILLFDRLLGDGVNKA